MAVDVVVAALGAGHFVAVGDHGCALGEQQCGEEVSSLLGAEFQDARVGGGAFHTTVPGSVVAFAVAVAFTIGHVVLFVVADQVVEGEAVVGDDKVDGGGGAPSVIGVEVGGAGEAGGKFAEGGRFAAPEVAHGVAVFAVPFGPEGWEVAHLIATLADVPRLSDEFDLGNHRVLLHQVEEGREAVHVVEFAGECGGQVETEAINVHFLHPVPQGIHDQLQGVRVTDVEGVSGARVVHVVVFIAVHQPVVGGVVNAAESNGGAHVVAFGGVVVHHVQDDFDACFVEGTDHVFEFGDGPAGFAGGGVFLVGGKESEGVVAPVVA